VFIKWEPKARLKLKARSQDELSSPDPGLCGLAGIGTWVKDSLPLTGLDPSGSLVQELCLPNTGREWRHSRVRSGDSKQVRKNSHRSGLPVDLEHFQFSSVWLHTFRVFAPPLQPMKAPRSLGSEAWAWKTPFTNIVLLPVPGLCPHFSAGYTALFTADCFSSQTSPTSMSSPCSTWKMLF
jgi:hypothetical protein